MHSPQRGRGAQHPDPSSGPHCLKISSDWAPTQQTMMMKSGCNKAHCLLEIYLALKVSDDDAFKAVNSQEVGAHLRSDLHGKSGENMRFIFGRYQVRVWTDVSSQIRVGVAWLLHFCVDQQPENLWNQDVWGRQFERAHLRIDFWLWATRQLHQFCWKWGFRYHQCTCRGDQQSRQEVSVFLQLTSSIRSTIGSALIGAHLKVKFGEFSEAVLVFAGSQDTPASFFGDRGVACSDAGNSQSAQSLCQCTQGLLKVLLHCFCLFGACARCELYFFER